MKIEDIGWLIEQIFNDYEIKVHNEDPWNITISFQKRPTDGIPKKGEEL